MDAGAQVVDRVGAILLSALESNPHNIEAWETLINHIDVASITNQTLIKRVYAVFRPHAMYYPSTFYKMIRSVSMTLNAKRIQRYTKFSWRMSFKLLDRSAISKRENGCCTR